MARPTTDQRERTPVEPAAAPLQPGGAAVLQGLVTERLAYLDALKILAMCAVVSIHIYGVSFQAATVGSSSWWLSNLLYTGSRWSVPVFVMASGALLLGRALEPGRFYRRRFGKILPATAVFVAAYFVLDAIRGTPLTAESVVAGLASGRPYNHLYFIAVIGGLYAVTPLFQAALRGQDRRFVWTAALGLVAMNALAPILGLMSGTSSTPNLVTWWIPFVGYYVLGFAIATSDRSMRPAVAWALALAAIGLGVITVGLAATAGATAIAGYQEDYNALSVVAASAMVFVAIRSVGPALARFVRPLTALAILTFGVYLIHLMVAVLLFRLIQPDDASVRDLTPIYVGTVVISFAACAVIARIRPVRWVIGL